MADDKPGKVTLREATPPKAPTDKKTFEITDELGRAIKVKKIGPLGRYDLAKLVGADFIANAGVMGPASLAYSVTELDGSPVFPPATENELRALIQRLDDEGITAVAKAYVDAGWVEAEIDAAAAKN